MKNKFATITIKREGSGPEIYMGLVLEEGTTHIKCFIPDNSTLRHVVDLRGEWYPRNSNNVTCIPHAEK